VNNVKKIKQKLDEIIVDEPPAIVGLGNSDRADDGFGIELARRLKIIFPEHVFLETENSVEGIVYDLLKSDRFDVIIFLDAVHFKGTQGELKIFDLNDIDKFASPISTHKVPMSLLMGLIHEHKKNSFLLGVQPGSLDFMGEMTPEVISSLDTIEAYFKKFFQDWV